MKKHTPGPREAIRKAMAKTFFATAWADYQEQVLGEGLQGDIMDQIPDTYPESSYSAANRLIEGMERINGMPIEKIFEACRDAEGDHHREPDEDEFGYCLAMQAMGHGVGWDDNHPSMFHEKNIAWVNPPIHRPQVFDAPYLEYTYFNLPDTEYPIPEETE